MKRLIAIAVLTLSYGALAAGTPYPPALDDTAEQIRNGGLDVGKTYTMEFSGRFHTIHAKALGMGCLSCHTTPGYASDHLFLRIAEFPQRGHPGAVGRATCISCHQEGGIAARWYGSAGK